MSADEQLAIERVLYTYCDAVDRVATGELRDLFTADAVLDYGFERHFHGRDAIVELLGERLQAYAATSHHMSNVVVHLDGERARSTAGIYAFHEDAATGEHRHVWGRYQDRLRREPDGAWRICERVIRAAAESGFPPAAGHDTAFEQIARSGPA